MPMYDVGKSIGTFKTFAYIQRQAPALKIPIIRGISSGPVSSSPAMKVKGLD